MCDLRHFGVTGLSGDGKVAYAMRVYCAFPPTVNADVANCVQYVRKYTVVIAVRVTTVDEFKYSVTALAVKVSVDVIKLFDVPNCPAIPVFGMLYDVELLENPHPICVVVPAVVHT